MEASLGINIVVKELSFNNFLPSENEEERYFFEVRSYGSHPIKLQPLEYDAFKTGTAAASVKFRHLLTNRFIQVCLYQVYKETETFLGDFEVDMQEYYEVDGEYPNLTSDLRNYKDFRSGPNYLHKDMRKKGSIAFDLKITS